jgi:hypothetical protein
MDFGEFVAFGTLCLLSLAILPIILHYRGERRKRELDHIERMSAIEVGRSYPGELKNSLQAFPKSVIPHLVAAAIGAVVPIGVFAFAGLVTLIGGFHKEIWVTSAMVGLGGVICGTVLAGNAAQLKGTTTEPDGSALFASSKPEVDEDAYDVVSTRG